MADLVERVQHEIHQRLDELRPSVTEYERLLEAQRALGDTELRPSRREATSRGAAVSTDRRASSSSRSARQRAPRGANRQAVLGAIRDRPGATAGELSAASNVRGATIYNVLRALTKAGEIEKHDLPSGRPGYRMRTPE